MNITELRNNLELFYTEGIGALMYFVLCEQGEMKVRLADIKAENLNDLKKLFLNEIKESILDTSIENNQNLQILNISSADERGSVLYKYDLDELPNEIKVLSDISENGEQPEFSSSCDNLRDLYAYVIVIGDAEHKLLLYKKHYPISTYYAQKHFYLFESNHRFEKLEKDMIKLDGNSDLLYINGVLLIRNLKMFERFFSFHDIVKREATLGITAIQNEGILDNPEELLNMLNDVSFARKLTKIASNSPVLGKIPLSSIIDFTKTHPTLKGKISYSPLGTQIHLDTKASKKLFLKILNDDFLRSELTKAYYDSLAKDCLIVDTLATNNIV